MAILDLVVDSNFRSESAGRVVIFPGLRRQGYLVKSTDEELKIRSFLKMFYFAHFAILSLGYFLAFEWSRELSYALGRQFVFVFRMGITLAFCSFIMGVPYWLLWRSYKKALLSFVSAQDEVAVSGKGANRRHWIFGIALAILLLLGGIFLMRMVSGAN